METHAEKTWALAARKLRKLLNEDTYDRWIAGIVPLSVEGSSFRLGVSNDIFSEWLAANYQDVIRTAIEETTGKPYQVVFESGHEMLQPPPPPAKSRKDGKGGVREPRVEEETPYNRRFTFDTFVVGENNKFSYAACTAVAKAPGKAYNPLFIHGATGLGKTHLLQAVAQQILGRRKRARVEYVSSEEFSNGFIDALVTKGLPKYRQHYRSVDALLIDDVHFFSGKEQFQEEFFHTFNALYNAHKQIVLTSDRPPHEIKGLRKRLVSRFEWGLTTEILRPDLETRVAILRKKQEDHAVKLDDEVMFFIAERIKSNIRRLEGALIRVVSYASMTGVQVSLDHVQQLLGPILEEEAVNQITVERIQRTVAEFYDIRVADMSSKKRPQSIAFPRQVAMFLSRRLTGHSSPAIGEYFSRNHATILHAVSAIEQRMAKDAEFRSTVGMLERKLKGY